MEVLTREQYNRVKRKENKPIKAPPKPIQEAAPPTPIQDTKQLERLANTQIEATLALTDVAAKTLDDSKLEEVLYLLAQTKPKPNTRLTINRDTNGLIESIDVKTI